MARRRNSLRLPGFDYADPDQVFFVTLRARGPGRPFLDPALAREVEESILLRAARDEWRLYAYCLMPGHLHLAASVGE
ncbi:MAG: hypothetical protein M0Z94_04335 [Dehalococcoidales bacterium]|nr:hypothetical protein [Dehalococcoidales bacterium]